MREPKDILLSEIIEGMADGFEVTITKEIVDNFLNFSGDHNPLHTDTGYAQTTPFRKRVVPGMLLASFFSRLVGMHLPGKKSLYVSQELKFKNPAFINDRIKIRGEVSRVSQKLGLITLVTTIYNQKSEVLVEGEARVKYLLI